MHNNFYFLKQLSAHLERIIQGSIISECYSQEKDELMLRFETTTGSFFIKTSVLPLLSCLSFPKDFQRAKKNSVDLFPVLIGQRVLIVRQFRNERSFSLQLSNGYEVLFKMHANRSNIVVFENEEPQLLFRKNIIADSSINLNALDRDIDWSFEAFVQNHDRLPELYFTFGKLIWQYLRLQEFDSGRLEDQWSMIQGLLSELENPRFYTTIINGLPEVSLVKIGEIKKEWNDPLSATSDFYYSFTQAYARNQQKAGLLSQLKNQIDSGKNYIEKNRQKLSELTHDNHYKAWADLIMANLHNIQAGSERVVLDNFYNDNRPVEIKLKKDLSAQRNAEVYYRKAKNQHLEIERLQQAIAGKEDDIAMCGRMMLEVEHTDDLKSIEQVRRKFEGHQRKQKPAEHVPYHEFLFQNFRIWVGKNAQANDELTFKFGYKEDLWLHAKDVAGSHVLIKYQSGKVFPKDVIERAAELAAYNSKRKTETLCPVVVTPRKFVRKRKGDPPGSVVVEREDVIMVEPKLIS